MMAHIWVSIDVNLGECKALLELGACNVELRNSDIQNCLARHCLDGFHGRGLEGRMQNTT